MEERREYKLFIGIDPGLTGAIAIVNEDGKVGLYDMPTRPRGGKVSREVSAKGLALILKKYIKDDTVIVLERVASRPQQGVAGMFSLGDSYGAVRGVVGGLGGFCVGAVPAVWRKGVGLKAGTGKDGSLALARSVFGREGLERKKDDGRADALLIAEYGKRRFTI